MPEIGTSSSMSEDGKRSVGHRPQATASILDSTVSDIRECSDEVRFSNRPFGVKRFQTIHHYSVDVAHGLVLLFGIGTKALVWGFFSQEV
jgi:hypothetical protein